MVEKPITPTVDDARRLIDIANSRNRILQVGHVERYNAAFGALAARMAKPLYIEAERLSGFKQRGADVDVVLDLMVHDLDVILSVTAAEVVSLEAVGVPILTDRIDVANARIRFSDGLIANLNTSRVAPRRERKIRFFQPDAYISVDYEARRIQVYRRSPPPPGSVYPVISGEQIELGEGDPLMEEVTAFVESVRTRTTPPVTAADGLRVMEVSEQIRAAIEKETVVSRS